MVPMTLNQGWQCVKALPVFVFSAIMLFPLLILASSWLHPDSSVWAHFVDTQLGYIASNTFWLSIKVAAITCVLGTILAWIVSTCEFPSRKIVEWLLVLPLAIPTYVMAFIFLGVMDLGGPLQTMLRMNFGAGNYYFPDPYGSNSVAIVLSLVLYPYVYLLARAAFVQQGAGMWDAARALGASPFKAFAKVALPVGRPAISAGVALVVMETLADFGAVAIFNYDTFSTAIYRTWFGLTSLNTAAQLSTVLLSLVIIMLLVERLTRQKAKYYNTAKQQSCIRFMLSGWKKNGVLIFCWSVIVFSFFLPVTQLIYWVLTEFDLQFLSGFLAALEHTLYLGLIASFIVVTITGFQVLSNGQSKSKFLKGFIFLTTLGYALPGTVLAVGVMQSFAIYDNWLNSILGTSNQQWLLGSLWALIVAYAVRFDTASFNAIDSGVMRIKPTMVDAAKSLGMNSRQLLRKIYIPILRPSAFAAFLLVGVDVMKELPATLLLRPFGWDTLATRIYQLTSEGEWEQSAPFALALLLVGLLPVILLVRHSVQAPARQQPELTLMQ